MKKTAKAVVAAPPQTNDGRDAQHAIDRDVRVVDAGTGETIPKVITADAEAGKLTRFDVDEDGNLVREKDAYKVIEEDRAIRIEWIEPPVTEGEGEGEGTNDVVVEDGDA